MLMPLPKNSDPMGYQLPQNAVGGLVHATCHIILLVATYWYLVHVYVHVYVLEHSVPVLVCHAIAIFSIA